MWFTDSWLTVGSGIHRTHDLKLGGPTDMIAIATKRVSLILDEARHVEKCEPIYSRDLPLALNLPFEVLIPDVRVLLDTVIGLPHDTGLARGLPMPQRSHHVDKTVLAAEVVR
jgi:hypothetical protein